MSERESTADQTLLETVERYYADKLRAYGSSPRGVDWKSAASQTLRFERLLKLLEETDDAGERIPGEQTREISLNDYGCGYGALADYLETAGHRVTYVGYDISASMVAAARERQSHRPWCSLTSDPGQLVPATFTVASGIFNVKLDHPLDAWYDYTLRTLDAIASVSLRGFSFNMLSTYSDADKRRADLFYADPLRMFDVCKRRFAPRVSLLHDYPLYEFTILVRK